MTETQTTPHAKHEQHVLPGHLEPHPGGDLLRVWCRWCCIWHQHGAAGEGPGHLTHRVAHCWAPDSPYQDSGYQILISPVSYATAKKEVRSATPAQQRAIREGRITAAVQRLRDQSPPQG